VSHRHTSSEVVGLGTGAAAASLTGLQSTASTASAAGGAGGLAHTGQHARPHRARRRPRRPHRFPRAGARQVGRPRHRLRFTRPYEHRAIVNIGHDLPQEAPTTFTQAVVDALRL
jgi:hypothetical protein